MKRTLLTVICTIAAGIAFTQTGNITITDNAGATELVEKHIYFNKEHNELPGWRIQVFASKSLLEAKDVKSSFLSGNDDMDAAIVFEAPNYKVRVGNYHNRFEANRDLQMILTYYPNAFICRDMIKINNN